MEVEEDHRELIAAAAHFSLVEEALAVEVEEAVGEVVAVLAVEVVCYDQSRPL